MRACIDLMASTLASLARGDAVLPLRTVIRLPDSRDAFAVMPGCAPRAAHARRQDHHRLPGQPRHGVRLASGRRAALRCDNGSLAALLDATSITTIRTAAVSAVATRALARARRRRRSRSSAPACRGTRTSRRCAPCGRSRRCASGAATPSTREVLADVARERFTLDATVAPTARDAVRDAEIVCTARRRRRPSLEGAWLSARHARERRRREHAERARGRRARSSCARGSTSIGASPPSKSRATFSFRSQTGEIAPEHIVAEIGEVLIDRGDGRRDDREITLFKSLGLAVEDLASAAHVYDGSGAHARRRTRGARRSASCGALSRAVARRRSTRRASASRRRRCARRSFGCNVDAPCEIYLKLENLQPIGSFKLRGALNAMRSLDRSSARARRVHGERGQHGAGRGVGRARARRSVHRGHARQRAAHEARRGRAARRRDHAACRTTSGGRRSPITDARASRERSFIPVADRRGDRGQRHDRPRDRRGSAGRDAVLVPFGGGGLVCGIATAVRALAPRARVYGCEGRNGDAAHRRARGRRAGARRAHAPSFVDGIGGRGVLPRCGRSSSTLVDGASSRRSRKSRRAVRLLVERARVVAEGAGATPVAAALSGRVPASRRRSCASSRAATSIRQHSSNCSAQMVRS